MIRRLQLWFSSNGNNNSVRMKEADQMIYHGGFCFLCWSRFPARLDDAESCHTLSICLPPVLNPSQRQHNEIEPPMQILTYRLYNARSLPALRLWSNPASSLLPGRCVIFCSSARTSSRHATCSFSLRGMGQMGRQTNKIKFTGKEAIKSEPDITWVCWSVSFPRLIKSPNILETSSAVTGTQWHII